MQVENYTANGKEYELLLELKGSGGKVTPMYGSKPLGITYSANMRAAWEFHRYSSIGVNALDELVKIAKDHLEKGIVAG